MSEPVNEHPLVQAAAAMTRQESTTPDPDLINTVGVLRRELDLYVMSLVTGAATRSEHERVAALLEDFAGVIRVKMGTREIGEALE